MISFVIPAYNEEALVADCIAAIRIDAHGKEYEIIVADNGSTDNTAEIARSWGARVVTETRKGVTRARQAGLGAARYGIVAFIDADNRIPQGWCDAALKALDGVNVVAASGPVVYNELNLAERIVVFMFYCLGKLAHNVCPMLQGGNFILRKYAIEAAGGFDTDVEFFGEDTTTAIRLAKQGIVNFDFEMFIWASARRMEAEGLFNTGFKYALNYVWVWATGHPYTRAYDDIRD